MKHARQKIREAVATILGGLSATVVTSRVYPMVNLPVVSIFADTETSEHENDLIGTPRRYTRRLVLVIEIVVEGVSGFDDDVDDLAAQIEALMAADVTLTDSATDSTLSATRIIMSGDSEKPVAKAALSYEVWYRTLGTDAENPL